MNILWQGFKDINLTSSDTTSNVTKNRLSYNIKGVAIQALLKTCLVAKDQVAIKLPYFYFVSK